MPDDLSYDPKAHRRNTDPDTSDRAARELESKQSMKMLLLGGYLNEDLTAEEATKKAGYIHEDEAWKRVSDLFTARLIENTGHKRRASTGRLQAVRRITTKGVKVLWS